VDGGQIKSLPSVVKAANAPVNAGLDLDVMCATAAQAASEILFELAGRQFTGRCGPVTVRPVNRPKDADSRSWGSRLSPLGWFSSWGLASAYGATVPGVVSSYGSSEPPTIRLPWPVREILQVKIDGTVIPSDEYEMRDGIDLVRLRTSTSAVPTERYGWPTTQIADLPDTEENTFSVTLTFGDDPPASGQIAARKLGEFLVLPQLGDTSRYPRRTTEISRQGVTAQVASVIDVLKARSLGIYEVDSFLLAVNPNRNQRRAAVISPDTGRPRRQATVSMPNNGG
jgi:hypothetical protein